MAELLKFKTVKSRTGATKDNQIIISGLGAICGNDQMMKFYTDKELAAKTFIRPRTFNTAAVHSVLEFLNERLDEARQDLIDMKDLQTKVDSWLSDLTYWS